MQATIGVGSERAGSEGRTDNLHVEHACGPKLASDKGGETEANAETKHDEVDCLVRHCHAEHTGSR